MVDIELLWIITERHLPNLENMYYILDMINKSPLYQQLNNALLKMIHKEKFQTGDKFLTERAICELFEVSRATANKALSSLVSGGILEFKKGVGTFIKSIPVNNGKVTSIFNFIKVLLFIN